jgi:hypothetical protein
MKRDVSTGSLPSGNTDHLSLAITLALDDGDPGQCGTAATLSVDVGDRINVCYTVTNHSGAALEYQSLSDSLGGSLFRYDQEALPDGASLQFNRVFTAGSLDSGTFTATWTSQDQMPGYQIDDTGPSKFVDISATGTALHLDDDGQADVTVPFQFTFYDMATDQLTIGNNGGIVVGAPGSTVTWFNTELPAELATGIASPAMLPLWDDFFASTTGHDVYYAVLGDAPNRTFAVEYGNQLHYSGPPDNTDGATFEVLINEGTGTFSFEYNDVEYTAYEPQQDNDPTNCTGGVCATVGIQRDGELANQYSYDAAALHDGQSIMWQPNVIQHILTANASATLDVGAPSLALDTTSFSVHVGPGAQTTAPLTIENAGTRDLSWSIDEAPGSHAADAHFPRIPYRAPALAVDGRHRPSTDRAPIRPTKAKGAPPTTSANAVHDAAVPAYGVGLDGKYYAMDASNPSSLSPVSSLGGDYYGGSFANNDFSKEYLVGFSTGGFASIDTQTGDLTVINPAPAPAPNLNCAALRWDASSATMYGACGDATAAVYYLYTVDVSSGVFSEVAEIDNVVLASIAFDASGNMYGLDLGGEQLLAIDKTTGVAQAIGPLGFDANYAQDMDFDPSTGVLWYAGYDKYGLGAMYTLDTTNGHAALVGPFPQGTEIAAFSVAVPSEGCASPEDVPWLSVSPASGTTSAGEDSVATVAFDATNLASGVYQANVCVHSNDAHHLLVGVPITLTVGDGGDTIFDDGFDGASP